MIRELYCEKTKKTSLSVTNTQITSVKKADVVKTGLRLYDKGFIGVAGAIGTYDENQLTDRAKRMLNFKIPYDCEPTGETKRTLDLTDKFSLTNDVFMRTSEELLAMLSRTYPQFSFSNTIEYYEQETELKNDCGTKLLYRGNHVQLGVLIKHKKSQNMLDAMGIHLSRDYDLQDAFKSVSKVCDCFEEKLSPTEAKMPVIFLYSGNQFVLGGILSKFTTDLEAHAFGAGASMFSGKIGQKLFSDDFSLMVDRSSAIPNVCFFDTEGTTLPEDRFLLIENGVLRSPFTAKRVAKQYGYALTGSAAGEYDSVPDNYLMLDAPNIVMGSSGKTIKELLGGRKAIYVVLAAGGDFTPQGEYATPVQSAFLFDGEKLCGRLPQLAIRSNVFDMFGKDFIGLATDGSTPNSPLKYFALDMHVDVIGDWI